MYSKYNLSVCINNKNMYVKYMGKCRRGNKQVLLGFEGLKPYFDINVGDVLVYTSNNKRYAIACVEIHYDIIRIYTFDTKK